MYENFYCATNWRFCEVISQRKLLYKVGVFKCYMKKRQVASFDMLTHHHQTFFYQVQSSEKYPA